MITRNYGIYKRSGRASDLMMWQLLALAATWGMIVVGFSGGGYIVVSAETPQAALEICKPMLAPGELLIYVEEIE